MAHLIKYRSAICGTALFLYAWHLTFYKDYLQEKNQMKYQILTSVKPEKLAEMVNNELESGWKLKGGVSVSHSPDGSVIFAQVITFTNKK